MENLNFYIIIPFTIGIILLIAYLIRRNNKDEKKVKDEFIKSDLKPDKHD